MGLAIVLVLGMAAPVAAAGPDRQDDDGSQDRIELGQTPRGDGLFALAEYPANRSVTRVSLLARAVTPRAHVSILLGR
jgi:hypothetical protein